MRRAKDQVRELLGPLDPMSDEPAHTPGQAAGDETDVSLLSVDSPRRKRRLHRPLLAAAAAVAVVTAGAVGWSSLGPSPSSAQATPPPLQITAPSESRSASEVLDELAERAAASDVPDGSAGDDEHIKMKNWYLHSQVETDDETISAIQPERNEKWRSPDGSGHWEKTMLEPVFLDGNDSTDWESGMDEDRSRDWPVDDTTYGGQRPPTDPGKLRDWLLAESSAFADKPEQLELVEAVNDLAKERVLVAEERAAVLQLLAELDELDYDGMPQDRADRTGHAFSLESDANGLPNRRTLIIDPDTGALHGYEEMLTEDPGKLNVAIPAVIEYETHLEKELR